MKEDNYKETFESEIQEDKTGSEKVSEESSPSEPFDPKKINIQTKPLLIDLIVKRLKVMPPEIDMNTFFQRKEGLWDDAEKSRLIESLMLKIPLPAFYFDATKDNKWLVVDGLQRLHTFKRFIINKDLVLNNLEYLTDFNGKNFDQLPRDMQRRIEETEITAFLILPGTPEEVKFNIFKRINTGGLVLSSQEIRHALNQGKPVQILDKISKTKIFKEKICPFLDIDRLIDKEYVLRFISFYNIDSNFSEYKPDMDNFLKNCMERLKKLEDKDVEVYEKKFESAVKRAINLFSKHAFRKISADGKKKSPLNKALFEVWTVSLSKLSEDDYNKLFQHKELLLEKYILTLTDNRFKNAVTFSTSNAENVIYRFKTIQKLIEEVINHDQEN